MQINLKLKLIDQPEKTVIAKAAELVAFENQYNLSVATLEKDIRYTYLLFFAWHAEKRTGATALEFNDWVNNVESVEAVETKK
jgi:hypothetical protein